MFDRYDERARRSIFLARWEASQFGSSWIDTEHLLLGILHEDWILRSDLPAGASEQIRAEIEQRCPPSGTKVSTSVDLPLSQECKLALAFCAEEAERQSHGTITAGHLVLGLLRVEECMAANILQQFGISLGRYREGIERYGAQEAQRPAPQDPPEAEEATVAAPALESAVNTLQGLVDRTAKLVRRYLDTYGDQRLKRKFWTRKEAFGHLIDWAAAHQQWFARALTEPNVAAAGYPQEDWISAQQYAGFSWKDTVDLWVSLNRLLIHVLARIPEDKLRTPCRIGVAEAIPLSALIAHYVEHCEDITGQIVAHL
ncbi:MAG TPA: Clp protease N-terminal domain-containing protein [Bryobacteraceae bacterium]|jgi:hypothetical protein|nr:Clp protease N-terminal domain-containing protein [Bryobacteraceae bacterium]